MNFHVGQKVVCVNVDQRTSLSAGLIPVSKIIEKGAVYVVRWVGEYTHSHPSIGTYVGVRLEGVRPRPGRDTPFNIHRFRPVKTTDISVFRAMLNPAPSKRKKERV